MSPDGTDGPTSHYFVDDPSLESDPSSVELTVPGVAVVLRTDRGVFGRDRVDPGTKLLLLEGPPVATHGAVLDLGCGYGAIAITLARRAPDATVYAVDVNERARELCRENATSTQCPNIVIASPDDVPDDIAFEQIWTNPPIRIGKPALRALLTGWLARLTPTGEALLVVHKHLGADSLATWLVEQGWRVERLRSRRGYRILRVAA